jgi:hypothetical protein
MDRSPFDVAANALEFFCAPAWKGPRRGTLLEVTILGDQRQYRVVAGRIERWVWERASLWLFRLLHGPVHDNTFAALGTDKRFE